MFPIISYGLEKIMQMQEMEDRGNYFDVDTVVNFGKHRGFTIEEIYEIDKQYLIWMYENFENTEWSDEVEELVTWAMDEESGYSSFYSYSGNYEGGHDLLDYGVDNPDDIFF